MELTSSPMTERQRNYRANYRYRIAGWYNGWIHVVVIYVIGFTALSVYIANISNLRWWELLIIPVTFVFANFFVPLNHDGLRADFIPTAGVEVSF